MYTMRCERRRSKNPARSQDPPSRRLASRCRHTIQCRLWSNLQRPWHRMLRLPVMDIEADLDDLDAVIQNATVVPFNRLAKPCSSTR